MKMSDDYLVVGKMNEMKVCFNVTCGDFLSVFCETRIIIVQPLTSILTSIY